MFGGYDHVYKNEIINISSMIAQHFMTVSSLVINCLLIYFIATGKGKLIGNYRMLITCFAVNDLIYTVTHFLSFPIAETYTDTLIVRTHGPVKSRLFLCLYMGNYGTSFPLLTAHFIYRALNLTWHQFSINFHRFLAITIAVTLMMAGAWFFTGFLCFSPDQESMMVAKSLMSEEEWSPIVWSGAENLNMMGTYWANGTFSGARWRVMGGAAIIISVMVTMYVTVTICTCVIVKHAKTNAMSVTTIRLQRQLFKCLLYQTIFPTFTAYFPATFCILAPIFGITWPPISIIMPIFCVMHPLFDGAVVLLNVSEYRKSLTRLLLCGRHNAMSLITPTTSLSNTSTSKITSQLTII